MGKYVFAYRGGEGMSEDEATQKAHMEAWMGWFGALGDAVVDGGNPFTLSKTVASDGSVSDSGGGGLGGDSIVTAADLAAAAELAKGCPVLSMGGTVDVYETIDVPM